MRKLVQDNAIASLRILLKSVDVPVTDGIIRQFRKHPEYPDLSAINYILQKIGVPNTGIRADYNYLQQLPKPMLVHLRDNGGMYIPVADVLDKEVVFINETMQEERQPREEFLKSYTNIALIVDKNGIETGSAALKEHPLKAAFHRNRFLLLALVVAAFTAYCIYTAFPVFTIYALLAVAVKMLGIAACIPLFIQMIDKNNPFVKKLCKSGKDPRSKADCNSILNAPAATVLGLLSWTDIGFLYFTSLYFFLLCFPSPSGFSMAAGLALLAVPYTLFSVYYQWRIARTWCRMCLAVQAILIADAAIAAYAFISGGAALSALQTGSLVQFLLTAALTGMAYYFIRQLLIEWKRYDIQFPKLQKMKLNAAVFNLAMNNRRTLDTGTVPILQFGNPDATHKIVAIVNPKCNPCIQAHKKLFAMLRYKEDTSLSEILLPEDAAIDDSYELSLYMLYAWKQYGSEKTFSIIDDYYTNYYVNHRAWIRKYFPAGIPAAGREELVQQLTAQADWCIRNNMLGTPMLLYNGKHLPVEYSVDDLDYLTS